MTVSGSGSNVWIKYMNLIQFLRDHTIKSRKKNRNKNTNQKKYELSKNTSQVRFQNNRRNGSPDPFVVFIAAFLLIPESP